MMREKSLISAQDSVGAYIVWLSAFPPLSADEQHVTAVRAHSHDCAARERLIVHNLRYAFAIARRYYRPTREGVDFADLIQFANIGLMCAVERFEPDRGVRFLTYAFYWIRQAIVHGMQNDARTVRRPVHIGAALRQLSRVEADLEQQLERQATDQELATALHTTVRHVRMFRILRLPNVDIDKLADPDGDSPRDASPLSGRLINGAPAPDVLADENATRLLVRLAVSTLNPQQRVVIGHRFGLDDGDAKTLKQIGVILKLSRERVRQIEAGALVMLRKKLGSAERLRRVLTADRNGGRRELR